MFTMLVGIDYSITCPCLCLYDERHPFKFDNCFFYYLTNTKKFADKILSVKCHGYEIGSDEFEAIVNYLESDVIGQYRERRAAEREAVRAAEYADSVYLLACEGW